MKKSKRLVVMIDLELLAYLQQRRVATGATIGELVRRDINLARYADQQAAKEQRASTR